MDDKTKDMFTKSFGDNVIFEDEEGIHRAAKALMPFIYGRMKPCEHEIVIHTFPPDPRLKHCICRCGEIEYLQMSSACAAEILQDKDTRNVAHRVSKGSHKLIELFGLGVRIVA